MGEITDTAMGRGGLPEPVQRAGLKMKYLCF